MRLFTLPFAFVSILLFSLASCNKYEDGPGISFLSRKERVVNDWAVKIAYSEDLDVTEDFSNFSINIKADGEFVATTVDILDSLHFQEGLWDLVSKDEEVRLLYTDPQQTPDRAYWKILRLKEEELWVSTEIDSVNYEVHFIPK